jgi:hypothetical protein
MIMRQESTDCVASLFHLFLPENKKPNANGFSFSPLASNQMDVAGLIRQG